MKVVKVKYMGGYQLMVSFANGEQKMVDMEAFLMEAKNPMTTQFQDINLFKQVRIERGNLTWLDNEMDISGESLYKWQNQSEFAM